MAAVDKKAGDEGLKTYLVEYKGLNFHTFEFPGKLLAGKYVEGGRFRFYPGFNKVGSEDMAKLTAHPMFSKHLEAGIFIVSDGSTLAGFDATKAKRIIEKTASIDLLNEWLANEKRGDIAQALRFQLEEVGPVTEKKGKAANDE